MLYSIFLVATMFIAGLAFIGYVLNRDRNNDGWNDGWKSAKNNRMHHASNKAIYDHYREKEFLSNRKED